MVTVEVLFDMYQHEDVSVRLPGSIKWRRVFEMYPHRGGILVTLDSIKGPTIGFSRQDELEATRG